MASTLSEGAKRESARASSLSTGPPEAKASSITARLTARSAPPPSPPPACTAAGTHVPSSWTHSRMAPCSAGTTSKIVLRIRSSSSGWLISLLSALPTS